MVLVILVASFTISVLLVNYIKQLKGLHGILDVWKWFAMLTFPVHRFFQFYFINGIEILYEV